MGLSVMGRQILPKGGGQLRQPGSGPPDSPEELEHLAAGLHRVVHGCADTGGAHLEALDGAGPADLGATPWWGTVWCPSGAPGMVQPCGGPQSIDLDSVSPNQFEAAHRRSKRGLH